MNSRRRSNNTQSSHNCVGRNNDALVPVRSLKRKKSSSSVIAQSPSGCKGRNSEAQRAENRVQTTSKTIQVVPPVSRQSPTRVISAMGRPSSLGSDLPARAPSKKDKCITANEETSNPPRDTRRHNVDEADRQHDHIPAGRQFTGPIAVAEYERMRREIETLKEALHEGRQICSRQAKVIITL